MIVRHTACNTLMKLDWAIRQSLTQSSTQAIKLTVLAVTSIGIRQLTMVPKYLKEPSSMSATTSVLVEDTGINAGVDNVWEPNQIKG